VINMDLVSVFRRLITIFPSNICWIGFLFSIIYFRHLCKNKIGIVVWIHIQVQRTYFNEINHLKLSQNMNTLKIQCVFQVTKTLVIVKWCILHIKMRWSLLTLCS
jgi:hypothetical protein